MINGFLSSFVHNSATSPLFLVPLFPSAASLRALVLCEARTTPGTGQPWHEWLILPSHKQDSSHLALTYWKTVIWATVLVTEASSVISVEENSTHLSGWLFSRVAYLPLAIEQTEAATKLKIYFPDYWNDMIWIASYTVCCTSWNLICVHKSLPYAVG